MTASDFIGAVLLARNDAEQLNLIVREAPELERKVRFRAKRHLKDRKYLEAASEQALLGAIIARRNRTLGREKTGPRMSFMRRMSAGLEQWCGQPLDNVVRVLTEIAFGEPVTAGAVRKARLNRTTQPPK